MSVYTPDPFDAQRRLFWELEQRIKALEQRVSGVEHDKPLDIKAAAEFLGTSERSLHRRTAPAQGKYYDADLADCRYMEGGLVRFDRKRLEAYRASRKPGQRRGRGRVKAVSDRSDDVRQSEGGGTKAA